MTEIGRPFGAAVCRSPRRVNLVNAAPECRGALEWVSDRSWCDAVDARHLSHVACAARPGWRPIEAERRASEIRLRAERKAGQLLAAMDKAKGKRTDLVASCDQVDDRQTLSELGVSKSQSSRWQKLAAVPDLSTPHRRMDTPACPIGNRD